RLLRRRYGGGGSPRFSHPQLPHFTDSPAPLPHATSLPRAPPLPETLLRQQGPQRRQVARTPDAIRSLMPHTPSASPLRAPAWLTASWPGSPLVVVTMSIHKLSAGSGYDYLTRQVA